MHVIDVNAMVMEVMEKVIGAKLNFFQAYLSHMLILRINREDLS